MSVVAFVVVMEDEVVDDIVAFSSIAKADAYVELRVRRDELLDQADRRSYARFHRKLDAELEEVGLPRGTRSEAGELVDPVDPRGEAMLP